MQREEQSSNLVAAVAPLFHPITGKQIRPLSFIRKDGRQTFIWPIIGGAEEVEETDDSQQDNEDDSDEEESLDPPAAAKAKTDDDDDDAIDSDDVKRLRRGWRNSEKSRLKQLRVLRATTAENETLKQKLAESGKTDEQRDSEATKTRDTAVHERDEALKQVAQMRVKVAFLSQAGFSWHDSEAALTLLDLDDVDIDPNGKIDRRTLRAAMRKLSKEKSYLVQAKEEGADEEKEEQERQPSGSPVGGSGGKKGKPKDLSTSDLANRFPALRGRR